MKRIIILIFLIFIYLFVIQNVCALEFVKAEENPLKINYVSDYTHHLQVNIFKEGTLYKGIFVVKRRNEPYNSLGYFESIDGFEWIMKKEILNLGADLSNPRILKIETGYLLFVSRLESDNTYQIYQSNCDLNFNCSENLLPVISVDKNNKSEKYGVFAGNPIRQGDRTYLFFSARGENGFKIKLSYSDDLINWTRCPNDKQFLYDGDAPFPYVDNNYLYLFFHRSDNSGIKISKSPLPLTCDSVFEDLGYLLVRDKGYDQSHLIFPSVLKNEDTIRLYYSGFGEDYQWHLNLACTEQACLSPTLTPIIGSEKTPIVIIPGTFASWNRDAVLHNKEVSYKDWKLQIFVKEYDGLINTLINLGYEINKNLFIFPFDWRQKIENSANDLNSFLKEKIWINNQDIKINIIGHSLGGLIGRIFTQKNKYKINQIISVGSPHQGVVQVYKPLESGEIDKDNTFFWLAAKTILILNKSTIESDRKTLLNKFPVAQDLFPTFNFLKEANEKEIDINNLSIKNSFLLQYNKSFSDIFPMFTAIYGEGGKNTPAGFIVESQSSLENLLGNYSDGKPIENYFDYGDYTVLSKSANQDNDSEKLNLDHGGLIYKKDGIKKILDILKIKYEDTLIVEGKGTRIDSSLIFLIKSPATMEVEFNNNIYSEEDGIIFIPDALSGSYNLKVKGIDEGKYEVIVGQISENNDLWENINGETKVLQIDEYKIQYNDKTAVSIFPILTIIPINGSENPTPSKISTVTPTSMGQIYLSPTIQPISIPILQPTNSLPKILGTSSSKLAKKAKIKKPPIRDYILKSLIISCLTITGWYFGKKILL